MSASLGPAQGDSGLTELHPVSDNRRPAADPQHPAEPGASPGPSVSLEKALRPHTLHVTGHFRPCCPSLTTLCQAEGRAAEASQS